LEILILFGKITLWEHYQRKSIPGAEATKEKMPPQTDWCFPTCKNALTVANSNGRTKFVYTAMKSKGDPRHLARRKAVRDLFAVNFTPQTVGDLAKKVLLKKNKIDKKIAKAAPAWPVENLNRIDHAVLQLALYELDYGNEPQKVIIDEAVELAKEFGSEASPSFVNGVLGTIIGKDL